MRPTVAPPRFGRGPGSGRRIPTDGHAQNPRRRGQFRTQASNTQGRIVDGEVHQHANGRKYIHHIHPDGSIHHHLLLPEERSRWGDINSPSRHTGRLAGAGIGYAAGGVVGGIAGFAIGGAFDN